MNKDEHEAMMGMLRLLRSGPAVVYFTKKDGTTRILKCTLENEFIEGVAEFSETGTRKQSDEVISVWDLENDGWRSFRVDSVQKLRPFSEKEREDLEFGTSS